MASPANNVSPASVDVEALKKNRPIVISGPSGAGKSTILRRLFEEFPDKFGFSVSHTTRGPRPGEENGREYHFTTVDSFEALIKEGGFIEYARYGSNYYGTSIAAIASLSSANRIPILDIEMEGVKQVASHPTFPRPRFLFLSPPSVEILEQRLRGRGTDTEDAIQKRLAQARNEMAFKESEDGKKIFELVVVNDELDKAYQEVRAFCVKV